MMVAGKLDRRITIQVKSVVKDSYGEEILTWATHLTVWSNPVQRDGKESDADGNRTTSRPVTFRTRWNSTFTNEMRIIWDGEYYRINNTKRVLYWDGEIWMKPVKDQQKRYGAWNTYLDKQPNVRSAELVDIFTL